VTTGYLAAVGFEEQLRRELAWAGAGPLRWHGRLALSDEAPLTVAWAANVWFDVERLEIASIADAARQLRDRQRNWACFLPDGDRPRGRAKLIADRLPPLAGRPLALGELAPAAPLGSWVLLENTVVLAAARCSSPFAHGEIRLAEERSGPPSRAYLKLWEALVRLGRWPAGGDRAVDLGASPGGWTWLLARAGARVLAVDRAPLDPEVAALAGVAWRGESAFGLDPEAAGPLRWWCSDMACYPERLLALLERWLATGALAGVNVVATVKLRGLADPGLVAGFRALPGVEVVHLHHNRNELTVLRSADEGR
jgi:23S rRNA (cytidine2498-2'-O)-methyltransferase